MHVREHVILWSESTTLIAGLLLSYIPKNDGIWFMFGGSNIVLTFWRFVRRHEKGNLLGPLMLIIGALNSESGRKNDDDVAYISSN